MKRSSVLDVPAVNIIELQPLKIQIKNGKRIVTIDNPMNRSPVSRAAVFSTSDA